MKNKLAIAHNSMKSRCQNKNNPNYYHYGGRGITVSSDWQNFSKFKEWALSHGYQEHLTLDRIDNDKGYSPDNCRWANMTVQKLNCGTYKNNTIGHKGISKRYGRFRARIFYHRKTISLGVYSTIEEAIAVREKAEKYYLELALCEEADKQKILATG